MMVKTNSRGRVTAIYLKGTWYFPKPMTKKRKKSVHRPTEIDARIDFFNYQQVYALQASLKFDVLEKDEFEIMVDNYVSNHHRTPCGNCRGIEPLGECPYDYQQEKCDKFKKMLAET